MSLQCCSNHEYLIIMVFRSLPCYHNYNIALTSINCFHIHIPTFFCVVALNCVLIIIMDFVCNSILYHTLASLRSFIHHALVICLLVALFVSHDLTSRYKNETCKYCLHNCVLNFF